MIPSQQEVLAVIQRVLKEQLQVDAKVTLATDLFAELKLDSIQQLSLVVELENHFRVAFDGGDEGRISTVQTVIDLVRRRLEDGDD
ncbi:MAG: acyl carrier protein [Deltaproteobacteria bacterium]|nr:acyl carrier protein [Deltaproteobacteria bacterium]